MSAPVTKTKGWSLPVAAVSLDGLLHTTPLSLLALTRRRPDAARLKKPRLMPTIEGFEFEGH